MADTTWIRKRVAEEVLNTAETAFDEVRSSVDSTLNDIQTKLLDLANEAARFAAACSSVNAYLRSERLNRSDTSCIWTVTGAMQTVFEHEVKLALQTSAANQQGRVLARQGTSLAESREHLLRARSALRSVTWELEQEDQRKRKRATIKKSQAVPTTATTTATTASAISATVTASASAGAEGPGRARK